MLSQEVQLKGYVCECVCVYLCVCELCVCMYVCACTRACIHACKIVYTVNQHVLCESVIFGRSTYFSDCDP